ncbi:MAG TPA: hypothetical protein VF845_06975 [Terriglobales bacterium]|jgi:hypothetical protein
MADFSIDEFVSLVRDFLADKKSWDDVHRFVIDAEWTSTAEIPAGHQDVDVLEELQMAFLADSKDDPQFLLSKSEVRELFDKLQSIRRKPS